MSLPRKPAEDTFAYCTTAPELPKNEQDAKKEEIEEHIAPNEVSAFKGSGLLDRFLARWFLLAMAIGIVLGDFVPNTGPALQKGKFVGVSVPIGGSIMAACIAFEHRTDCNSDWLTRHDIPHPILRKVKYETLHQVFRKRDSWIQIAFSIVMNWLIAPFLMVKSPTIPMNSAINVGLCQLGLSWAFSPDKSGLRKGLILVGLARCNAMVGVPLLSTTLKAS